MTDPIKRAGLIVGILAAAIAAFFAVSVVSPNAAMAQGTPTVTTPAAPDAAAQPGAAPVAPAAPAAVTPEAPATGKPHLILTLKDGPVDIELLPELAPEHVKRVIELTEAKFYDGIVFHRVIPGFMAQTGDPTGTGMGGSQLPDLNAEFNTTESFTRGVIGAARSGNPNSANSQFFITYADAPWLDGQYTIWGRVVSGMEAVDLVTPGEPPATPDAIISATIEYK
jgi:peptidylprolyl isomerase